MKNIFVIFFVGLSSVPFLGNALSHDEKVQKISHSYMALKNVVASLIRVDSELQETLSGADDDISTLTDSKTRNEFEVRVMNMEDAKMRADASKRTLTAEEIQVKKSLPYLKMVCKIFQLYKRILITDMFFPLGRLVQTRSN